MTKLDQILSEFIDAWNAGERPQVDDHLARAPEARRGELADLIGSFLEWAPAPRYSEETLNQIRAEPATRAAAGLIESQSGLWPALLPYLRKRAQLTRDRVVAALCEALGLKGREADVKPFYHEMETGTLDAGGVSRRVIVALAGVFGVSAGEIEEAGDFHGLMGPAPEGAYLRLREPGDETVAFNLSVPMLDAVEDVGIPGIADEAAGWDEVDRLFLGGR
jgi:hypothetical protein